MTREKGQGGKTNASRSLFEQYFPAVLFLIACGLLVLLIRPFAGAFFASIVAATLLTPAHAWLKGKLGGRTRLSAGALTALVLLMVLVPATLSGLAVGREVIRGFDWVATTAATKGWEGVVEPLPASLRPSASWVIARLPEKWKQELQGKDPHPFRSSWWNAEQRELPSTAKETARPSPDASNQRSAPPSGDDTASLEPEGEADSALDRLSEVDVATIGTTAGYAGVFLQSLFSWAVGAGMMLAALFFLLAEGDRLLRYLKQLVPLEEKDIDTLLEELREVASGVFRATVVTAFAQSLAAVAAYAVVGLPSLPLLAFLTLIGALIPVVGAGSIALLLALVLLLSGQVWQGTFLAVWAFLVVGSIDNLLKPLLASDRARQPSSVIFFSMLCGLVVFGPMGLVAGPLTVSFFVVSARFLRGDVGSGLDEDSTSEPNQAIEPAHAESASA